MNEQQFPKASSALGGTNQPELFIRDLAFLNAHYGHDKLAWFKDYDVIDAQRFEDDFLYYVTGDFWTGILTGGSGSIVVADAVNGHIVLTTHTDATDSAEIYQTNETWRLYAANPLYFEARFKVTTALTDKVYVGLGDANGEYAVGFGNGVYFMSDGDGNLDFKVEAATVVQSLDTGVNLADLTWIRVAFHWDGALLRWFVFDDDQLCVATGTYVPATAIVPVGYEMGLAFGVKSPAVAGAVAGYLDYVKCVAKRYVA
jgi:hypothetical protein